MSLWAVGASHHGEIGGHVADGLVSRRVRNRPHLERDGRLRQPVAGITASVTQRSPITAFLHLAARCSFVLSKHGRHGSEAGTAAHVFAGDPMQSLEQCRTRQPARVLLSWYTSSRRHAWCVFIFTCMHTICSSVASCECHKREEGTARGVPPLPPYKTSRVYSKMFYGTTS